MYKSLEDIIVAEKEKNLPFWKIVMQDDCVELDISEEEQAVIGLFGTPQHKAFKKPNASRDEVRKARREGRDAKIIQLHETGLSQSEIARQLEINRKTVSKVLKNTSSSEETAVVETEDNLSKNGSINDCLISGAWLEREDDYDLYISEGQYEVDPDTTMPKAKSASKLNKQTNSIIAFPRPGPS